MYKKIKLLIVILIGIVSIKSSFAQTEDTSDFASWNAIGLEYKLNKKVNLGLEQHLRLKDDLSEIDNYFTQLNASYKLFKGFKIGLGLRYIRDNDTEGNYQGFENHFRFNLDAIYKHELDRFSLGYRLRYQNKNELGISSANGDYAKNTIRFKTALGYNIKKWPLDPSFSAEIFNSSQEENDNNGFSKYRLTFGTDFKIKDIGEIKLYYRAQKELNVDAPETLNIIGFKYTYKIKNK